MDSIISWAVLVVAMWAGLVITLLKVAKKNSKTTKDIYIKLF